MGRRRSPAWDLPGSLRLLLAIEETFGVSIREEEMRGAGSVRGTVCPARAQGPDAAAASRKDMRELVHEVLGPGCAPGSGPWPGANLRVGLTGFVAAAAGHRGELRREPQRDRDARR